METRGSGDEIGAAEAREALSAVEESRARLAWRGYPHWYWLLCGACFAAMPVAWELDERRPSLPWMLSPGLYVGVVLVVLAVAGFRARRVRERYEGTAVRWRDGLLMFGPTVALLGLALLLHTVGPWWAPLPVAALVFVVFSGTGLVMQRRVGRR